MMISNDHDENHDMMMRKDDDEYCNMMTMTCYDHDENHDMMTIKDDDENHNMMTINPLPVITGYRFQLR